MAIIIDKRIAVTGTVMIGDDVIAMLTANISNEADGLTSVTTSITSKEAYIANKEVVRADIEKFKEAIYEIEDQEDAE
ncbi:gp21 [Brochothrix phage BL3]|uniref:gp21 n=1 Tax=Brochothrix phage BL3 TaxID=764562 RepID=UPI0001D9ADBE|nr:gp21 [Brochothrix phage BL3]ADH03102.1 gp21 [Brochothrix phage BL3]